MKYITANLFFFIADKTFKHCVKRKPMCFLPNHDDNRQLLKPKQFVSCLSANRFKLSSRRKPTFRSQFPEQCFNALIQLLNCVYEKWNLEAETTPKRLPPLLWGNTFIKNSDFFHVIYTVNLYFKL